jgi:hypothetical protein
MADHGLFVRDAQLAATEVAKGRTIRNALPREIMEPIINKFDPSATDRRLCRPCRGGLRSGRVRIIEDRIRPEISRSTESAP